MEKVEFYKSLQSMEDREAIKNFLVYNSSLVIAGVKPSVTLTIKKSPENTYESWIKYGKDFLENINLKSLCLREEKNASIILVYNENILKEHILKKENIEFLNMLGYKKEDSIYEYVQQLKERYQEFNCPHELGIFLGIPIDDVKDFMECSSKRCLGCGYWKVYSNYEEAKRVFKNYDEIREKTMKNILSGIPIDKIISNISFYNYDQLYI
ncbi:DUF3793 family protein [Clostridium sartagoforme]|uniref:DUF3793 family protein n=1 Tax=Clostridium sartagoforme TaxID=84031 RepID=UPI0031D31628